MDELKVLISVISKQKLKKLDIISSNNSLSHKSKALYNGIFDGSFTTDDIAAKALYNSDASNPSYKRLKSRLSRKLLNTIFIINADYYGPSDYSNALLNVSRDYIAALMIHRISGLSMASRLLEKAVRTAQRLEEPSIGFLASKQLIIYYSFIDENAKKLAKCIKQTNRFLEMLQSELKVVQYYGQVSQEVIRSRTGISKEYKEKIGRIYKEISELKIEDQSYRCNVLSYELKAHYFQLQNETKKRIQICEEGLKLFESKSFVYEYGPYVLRNELIDSYLQNDDYVNAEFQLYKNINVIGTNNFNFFRVNLTTFSIKCALGDWQALYDITVPIINSKKLSHISLVYESWLIREAYVHFLIKISKIDPSKSKTGFRRKFRLSRNLNDIPTYAKSKRATNIPVIVLQLLFFIVEKNYDKIYSRTQALNQYCHKYLRKDDTFRSNCFIKMLMKIPEAEYHPIRLKRYANKYMKMLETKPFKISFRTPDSEVIPYEVLWEMILDQLNINQGK